MSGERAIEDWHALDAQCEIHAIGDAPSEAWFWRDIRIEDRLEAVERMRRDHHGWEQGHEPALERITRLVRYP